MYNASAILFLIATGLSVFIVIALTIIHLVSSNSGKGKTALNVEETRVERRRTKQDKRKIYWFLRYKK